MEKLLLLGAEAIAQGAIDGGMSGVYAYPGTPSTEITEYVQHNKMALERKLHSQWSANEKTAMEAGLGMSYAGKRAMVCMKHVGLNVAADAFINSAITGVNGGLIVTVADDPSMHSSQNEQDSRFFGKFAMIPIFEPASQQEAYDMAYEGFELSEKLKIPIMMRITTRLSHSRAGIETRPLKQENKLKYPEDPIQFVLLPSNARKRYKGLLSLQSLMEQESERSSFNTYYPARNKSLGIIACGIAFNYLMENYPERKFPHPVLQLGQYPLPFSKVEKIVNECEHVLILEDMGASITMAKGAADAGVHPAIAVIGDSTFTHSGMTALLDAIVENTPMTVIISDNGTTGMTGGQASHATGRLEEICIGLGVKPEHVKVLTPLPKYHDEMVKVLREEMLYEGVSVVIPRRECIQTLARSKKEIKVKVEEVS